MNEALLSVSQFAAQVVVAGLWQGSIIAAFVAIGLRCLPRISAAQRFMVWAAAFALVLVLPVAAMVSKGSAAGSTSSLHLGAGWGFALAALWVATFAFRTSGLILQTWRVRQIWLRAKRIEAPHSIAAILEQCPRNPGLFTSRGVDVPSVIGFLSPRLLIPVGMSEQLTEDELRQIVLHECEHLRRHDDWLNLLQKVALAAFPLHVALVWMDRRLGLERELACDAGVIAATGNPLDYAACLARLAEHRMSGSRLALALSAWARRSELAQRVYTLLDPARVESRRGSKSAMMALACVLAVLADGIAHAPQWISFAQPMTVTASAPAGSGASGLVPVVLRVRENGGFHAVSVSAAAPAVARRAAPVRASRKHVPRESTPHLYSTVARPTPARSALVEVRFSYSYAAVPFGDGWLIVQL